MPRPGSFSIVALLLVATLAAGCDRPFVAIDPPRVEVVEPTDLGDVREEASLGIALRVSAVRGVARVDVAGAPAERDGTSDLYRARVSLSSGLNAIPVEAEDVDGIVTRDTVWAVRLRFGVGIAPTADLPEGLAYHSATALGIGRVVVAGGAGADGLARSSLYVIDETGTPLVFTVTPAGTLATARASHAALRVPDGRVLLLGGSTRAEAASLADLVEGAEVVDTDAGTAAAVATRGAPLRRAGHAAALLEAAGRTFVYVWGGRAAGGSGLVTPSSYEIYEWKPAAATGAASDSLVTLTPPNGVGTLQPVTRPAYAPLASTPAGTARALSTGLYVPEGSPVAAEFRFRPGAGRYPFEIIERALVPPATPRTAAAADRLTDALALLTGGQAAGSSPVVALDLYAPAAGRFFRVPTDLGALRTPRYGHTATSLGGGRILVLGGYPAAPSPTATAEVILTQ